MLHDVHSHMATTFGYPEAVSTHRSPLRFRGVSGCCVDGRLEFEGLDLIGWVLFYIGAGHHSLVAFCGQGNIVEPSLPFVTAWRFFVEL